jgi:hypothetical protein
MLAQNLFPVTHLKMNNLRINLYLSSSNMIRKMKSLGQLTYNPRENINKERQDTHNFTFRKLTADDEQINSTINRELLIDKIIEFRKNAAMILQTNIRIFLNRKEILKREFIRYIISCRNISAMIIQKTIRMYLTRKAVRKVINPKHYICIYQIEKKCGLAKVQIKLLDKKKLINFSHCKPLDLYYAYIYKPKLLPKRLKVHFLINNKIVIDSRYPVDCTHGEFYNIVETGSIFKKPKGEYERIFEIVSEKSVSSQASDTIDKLFRHKVQIKKTQPRVIKSILRKGKLNSNKSVSFATSNQYYN